MYSSSVLEAVVVLQLTKAVVLQMQDDSHFDGVAKL